MGRAPARTRIDRPLWGLVALTTVAGFGHHVDHVVRGNHVGWPITGEVTAFTVSLLVYPLVALGLFLTAYRNGGPAYWAVLSAAGAALIWATHFSPWAVEPLADVVGPYGGGPMGIVAVGWLFALQAALVVTAVYAAALWYRERRPSGAGGRAG